MTMTKHYADAETAYADIRKVRARGGQGSLTWNGSVTVVFRGSKKALKKVA